MLYRVGISMDGEDLRHLKLLQKRFGARSRSELLRELMKRYEKLESQWNTLNRCIRGYLEKPESSGEESRQTLKATMKGHQAEDWS